MSEVENAVAQLKRFSRSKSRTLQELRDFLRSQEVSNDLATPDCDMVAHVDVLPQAAVTEFSRVADSSKLGAKGDQMGGIRLQLQI